jgi:carboxylesterase
MAETDVRARGATLVLLHGLLSTPSEFFLISSALRRRGVRHHAPAIPGYTHGGRARRRTHWLAWIEAALRAIEAVSAPDEPLVLAGLCTGGLLAAGLALRLGSRVRGLAMLSPTFSYDGWGLSRWRHWRYLAYWLRLDGFIRIAEREPYGIKNPRMRHWIALEMKARAESAAGPAHLPLWALRENEELIARVRGQAGLLDCPLLVMHAREDEITQLRSVEGFFRSVGVPDKRLVVLEDSYHIVTIDNDRHRVASELSDFAVRVGGPA